MGEDRLPKALILDPRSRAEALGRPIVDAANIPFTELPLRTHELPNSKEIIRVANVGPTAEAAIRWLDAHGRYGETVSVEFSRGNYQERRLWDPNPLLEEFVGRSVAGNAIDLGCGTGRDAIYLAANGWQVQAVDVLPDAIERGRSTASRILGKDADLIQWHVTDVRQFAASPNSIDLVLSFFFLDRVALRAAVENLRIGGTVLAEVYTPTHRKRFGKPRDAELTLSVPEASALLTGVRFRRLEESLRQGRHLLRLEAVREN